MPAILDEIAWAVEDQLELEKIAIEKYARALNISIEAARTIVSLQRARIQRSLKTPSVARGGT